MAVFGVEQIQKSRLKARYFDKYVIILNVSAIIAVLGIRSLYRDNKQYFLSCAVEISILVLSIFLFVIGWRYYSGDELYSSCDQRISNTAKI